jgi:tetraacyldisaccharide 4'-kinase
LVDAGSGNGWPLPAGPLREFSWARARAQLVWGRDGVKGDISAQHRVRRVRLPDGNQCDAATLAGRSVVVLTAIARPARLLTSLEALNARVVAVHAFADHHLFTAAELAPIVAQAEQSMSIIVTTEKDLERLTIPVHALVQDLELEEPTQLPPRLRELLR